MSTTEGEDAAQLEHGKAKERIRLTEGRALARRDEIYNALLEIDDLLFNAQQVWLDVEHAADPNQPDPAGAVTDTIDELLSAREHLREARHQTLWVRQMGWTNEIQEGANALEESIGQITATVFAASHALHAARQPGFLEKQLALIRAKELPKEIQLACKKALDEVESLTELTRMLPEQQPDD